MPQIKSGGFVYNVHFASMTDASAGHRSQRLRRVGVTQDGANGGGIDDLARKKGAAAPEIQLGTELGRCTVDPELWKELQLEVGVLKEEIERLRKALDAKCKEADVKAGAARSQCLEMEKELAKVRQELCRRRAPEQLLLQLVLSHPNLVTSILAGDAQFHRTDESGGPHDRGSRTLEVTGWQVGSAVFQLATALFFGAWQVHEEEGAQARLKLLKVESLHQTELQAVFLREKRRLYATEQAGSVQESLAWYSPSQGSTPPRFLTDPASLEGSERSDGTGEQGVVLARVLRRPNGGPADQAHLPMLHALPLLRLRYVHLEGCACRRCGRKQSESPAE